MVGFGNEDQSMEDRFEFVNDWPDWRRENVTDFERIAALGAKLWGNAEHLKLQLSRPTPGIPPGVTMDDLLALKELGLQKIWASQKWMPEALKPIIVIGDTHFGLFEAMHEVVLRAIAAFGN